MTKLRRVGKLSDRMHPPTWAMTGGRGVLLSVHGWMWRKQTVLHKVNGLALTVSQNMLAEDLK